MSAGALSGISWVFYFYIENAINCPLRWWNLMSQSLVMLEGWLLIKTLPAAFYFTFELILLLHFLLRHIFEIQLIFDPDLKISFNLFLMFLLSHCDVLNLLLMNSSPIFWPRLVSDSVLWAGRSKISMLLHNCFRICWDVLRANTPLFINSFSWFCGCWRVHYQDLFYIFICKIQKY